MNGALNWIKWAHCSQRLNRLTQGRGTERCFLKFVRVSCKIIMKFSLRCCNSSCYIFRCVIKGWKENFVEQYLSKYKRDVTTYLALISAYAFYISQLPCCLWQNFNIRLYIIKKNASVSAIVFCYFDWRRVFWNFCLLLCFYFCQSASSDENFPENML